MEDNIISIAIAWHLGEYDGLRYSKKDFDMLETLNNKAWMMFWKDQK